MKSLHVGKGFNIVEGTVCRRLYDRIRAHFSDGIIILFFNYFFLNFIFYFLFDLFLIFYLGAGQKPKFFHYFDDYRQYEMESAKAIGLDPSHATGIFSLCKESEFMPFLTGVEDLPQNLHYFMTSTEGI
jgi:hypothetical protein